MAKQKRRASAQKRTASKRGKASTKINSAPSKSTKRTRAKARTKKAAHRVATKTKSKKQAIKPRARRAAPKKAAPQPTELSRQPADATDETVIVDIIEQPVPGVVIVTEFESVTNRPEVPGPEPEGKESSDFAGREEDED